MTEQEEREALRDDIAYWPIGSGYYQTSIGIDEARDIADHLVELGWHRQGQITEAMVEAAAIACFASADGDWEAEDWPSDWLQESTRDVWRKYARAALEAAEEVRRG